MSGQKIADPKIVKIEIRVTPSEKSEAKRIASLMGVSVSDFLRGAIEQAKVI